MPCALDENRVFNIKTRLRIVMHLKTVKYALKIAKICTKNTKICTYKLQNIYIKHHDCIKLLNITTKKLSIILDSS
jgi:hypothetical protein